MATRRTIVGLSEQIDRIVRQLNPAPAVVTLQMPHSMVRTEYDRVLAKHWELFPQDQNSQLLVVVQLFGENDPDHYDVDEQPGDKVGMAWRAIARENRATNPLQFCAASAARTRR